MWMLDGRLICIRRCHFSLSAPLLPHPRPGSALDGAPLSPRASSARSSPAFAGQLRHASGANPWDEPPLSSPPPNRTPAVRCGQSSCSKGIEADIGTWTKGRVATAMSPCPATASDIEATAGCLVGERWHGWVESAGSVGTSTHQHLSPMRFLVLLGSPFRWGWGDNVNGLPRRARSAPAWHRSRTPTRRWQGILRARCSRECPPRMPTCTTLQWTGTLCHDSRAGHKGVPWDAVSVFAVCSGWAVGGRMLTVWKDDAVGVQRSPCFDEQ
jgi:hypothetical protein